MSTNHSPLRAIREHCLECSGSASEVRKCPCVNCKLYPYRFGKKPPEYRKKISEAHKEKLLKNNPHRQQKPLTEGTEKSGGKDNIPKTPKPNVTPPPQKSQKETFEE